MTKREIVAIVAEKTGIAKEYVLVIVEEAIDEIKRQVEAGEVVTVAGFMSIYLRERPDFVGNAFIGKKERHDRNFRTEQHVYRGGAVPWVRISKKWRKQCQGRTMTPKQTEDKNQLSLFQSDDVTKQE